MAIDRLWLAARHRRRFDDRTLHPYLQHHIMLSLSWIFFPDVLEVSR